jgi:hypothetical protein
MRERGQGTSENVVPFPPIPRDSFPQDGDALDNSGRTILELLQRAANAAKDRCGRALGVAHGLSVQLRAAEDRIKDLEAELSHYQNRALRAENWLRRIAREIEKKFLDASEPAHPRGDDRRGQPPAASRRF